MMGARLVAALCLSCLAWLAGSAHAARPALDGPLSLAAFQAYRGETFRVWGGEGARAVEELRLVEIRDQGSDGRIEQFTVRFRAELTSTLAKASYSFQHPESGYFDLWLEPAGQDENGRYFEARFSLVPERRR
jgi:hypothetical protein